SRHTISDRDWSSDVCSSDLLLIGNSGSGKTTLMRSVEQFLTAHSAAGGANVVRINANVLADEHGGYGKAVLGRLWANARRLGVEIGRAACRGRGQQWESAVS